MNFTKRTISLLALAAVAWHTLAWAGDLTPEGLAAKYPSGSIQNQETADQALREVDQQRANVEQKFAVQQHDCYAKFFATNCLDAASEERRIALAQIRKVEVDANAYTRAARVVERDRNLADKRARDAGNPPKPLTDAVPKQSNSPDAVKHDPNEEARRIAEHDAKVKAEQQDEAAKAPERAAKADAYNKKVADAEARQRDVAKKKADKQKQAEDKAAKARKDAAAKGKAAASSPASGSAAASAPASAATSAGTKP